MPADGTYTGVVDRFEGDLAVVLLEVDGETVGERALDRARLPEAGRSVDAVLRVEVEDGRVAAVSYDPDESERRSGRARRRFGELSSRPPAADDDPDSD
ncbi:DUF3006 family protein [Halobacterium jilantaiense]|uniref:DUF3006 family protein n=1 Tax=Halobacterium jilantaiense TaxID=355548 RepID=A0A1I0MUL4_9EURY|nr:DUF3006 family protein [Halobacterium jilantaiense]SEV92492.1 Protein of unknown function [Halobacterium jilantaiense]